MLTNSNNMTFDCLRAVATAQLTVLNLVAWLVWEAEYVQQYLYAMLYSQGQQQREEGI